MIVKDRAEQLLYRVSSPERYTGNEWNQIVKKWTPERIKIALAFPDIYEIGMSHLGLKILYHLLNKEDDIICERTYAPWSDMEQLMIEEELPLYALESGHEIRDFDIFAFTLQYEMSYTNILNMLNLGGIPLKTRDRDGEDPLIIGGGATVFNPEPLADFFDLFFIGEAEASIVELVNNYREYRDQGLGREAILRRLSQMKGVYVPSLYKIKYDHQGQIISREPDRGIKPTIRKQVVTDLDQAFYPTDFIVPYMDIVHNRAVLEISRGCTRGCRFCAAGISYRPVRERSPDTLLEQAEAILKSTGYGEISLTSLSTVDYTGIEQLVSELATRYQEQNISLSLSSLRVDTFSVKLAREVQKVRKTGLTFAPEAGSQRLRNVINKGVREEELYQAVRSAFESGWSRVKLYFMIGLPTETKEDLSGLVDMIYRVRDIGREIRKNNKQNMRPIQVNVSVSTFVPKPFTPFQWVSMINKQEIIEKQDFLRQKIRGKGLQLSWNEPELSLLEGVMARGDRRLAPVLETAWEKGARFDGWNEHFDFNVWQQAFNRHNLSINDYLQERDPETMLPWGHLDVGVDRQFLKDEYRKALAGEPTPDCRFDKCTGCNICFNFDVDLELMGADERANKD